ncbi:MAG: metallophosphoesterase family protein [Candidatus Omnitrophica bacterium]|nr:metallophosphoesterase family protein [Candidatus Omnitrophota bacterium]
MDEALINNWNNVVQRDDIIYHLGDFCFKNNFNDYFKRLEGKIILIKGNHDSVAWKHRHEFYAYSDFGREIEIDGQEITLTHFAMRTWNKSHFGAFNLYGHSHSTLPDDPNSLSMDVGVDGNNFTPISFEQVKERMSHKTFVPIDHHKP